MSVALYLFAYAQNDRVRMTPDLQDLVNAVQADDRTMLRKRLEALREASPNLWDSSEGKHVLRRLASLAASLGFRDMLFLFLVKYHVSVHATHEKLIGNDSNLTPMICSFKYKDLSLELLSLGTIDISLNTHDGYNLVQLAIKARAPDMARLLLGIAAAELDLDLPAACGHTTLCTAAMEGDLANLNLLLGMYKYWGLLTEALMRPCDTCKRFEGNVRPFPLLYHAKNVATARLLMTWLSDSVGPSVDYHGSPGPVHRAAASGDLSLLKFFTEECGLSIDGPDEGKCACCTPLASACKSMRSTPEVVRYLLDNGADAVMRGLPRGCRSPTDIALAYGNKNLHRLMLRFESERTEEATRNLMFQLDAIEEVRNNKASKKNKKKKPLEDANDGGFLDLDRTSEVPLALENAVSCEVSTTGDGDAPQEFVCPIELTLMVDDPVLASDGFTYSRAGLEKWISRCKAAGLPLTSPLTGEVMDAAFYENKTHRVMVRRWVEQRSLGKE